jgi:hypothetical protein
LSRTKNGELTIPSDIISTLTITPTDINSKWQIVGEYRNLLKTLLKQGTRIVFIVEFHLPTQLRQIRLDQLGSILLMILEKMEQKMSHYVAIPAIQVKVQKT